MKNKVHYSKIPSAFIGNTQLSNTEFRLIALIYDSTRGGWCFDINHFAKILRVSAKHVHRLLLRFKRLGIINYTVGRAVYRDRSIEVIRSQQ